MNPITVRSSLTWLTFTAAIAGALLLAGGEPGFDVFRAQRPASAKNGGMPLPSEATAAGGLVPHKSTQRAPIAGSGASGR